MRLTKWGATAALVTLFLAQGGVWSPGAAQQAPVTPLPGSTPTPPGSGPNGKTSPTPLVPVYSPVWPMAPTTKPSASPSALGGGGGPVYIGPGIIRFDPPADHRDDVGPAGTPEPTLGPGSPAPRR